MGNVDKGNLLNVFENHTTRKTINGGFETLPKRATDTSLGFWGNFL